MQEGVEPGIFCHLDFVEGDPTSALISIANFETRNEENFYAIFLITKYETRRGFLGPVIRWMLKCEIKMFGVKTEGYLIAKSQPAIWSEAMITMDALQNKNTVTLLNRDQAVGAITAL